jgi:hypothetical protein
LSKEIGKSGAPALFYFLFLFTSSCWLSLILCIRAIKIRESCDPDSRGHLETIAKSTCAQTLTKKSSSAMNHIYISGTKVAAEKARDLHFLFNSSANAKLNVVALWFEHQTAIKASREISSSGFN